MSESEDDLWVFGYGSLMWRPGFDFIEAHRARIVGYQRAFCIYSTHHRGSEERPGLVLGLDRGGACAGIAYRVAPGRRGETISYLRAREQVSGVYRETFAPIQLLGEGGHDVTAVTYVVERAHPSYAHRLAFAQQVAIIRGAHGLSGPNVEYLVNTSAHLRELGIRDRNLERLAAAAGGLFAACHGDGEALQRRARALAALCSSKPVRAGPRLKPEERRRFLHRTGVG
jgi:cation transport protein ChaC